MSNPIVESMKGPVMNTFKLLEKFLEVCPPDLWESVWASWTVWQQYYHTIGIVGLFVPAPGGEIQDPDVPPEVAQLKAVGTVPVSVEKMKAYHAKAVAAMESYFSKLTDATLAEVNEKAKAVVKLDWSHAATLLVVAGHNEYHLGIFDAALRERKLPGVF